MTDPDIVVLRQKPHGMPAEQYAAALRERLPDREVVLARTAAEERDLLRTATVATGPHVDREAIEGAERLELFACAYAGTGHLPMDALEERNVAVTNASGVHGPNIAEYAVGSLVSLARRFPRAVRQRERREWRSYQTNELMGSTVTVVGLGAIGQALVERLEPFGVETIGVRYSPEKGGPTDEVLGFDEIDDALARADYLVLACPLTETTRGLIGTQQLRTLSPDAGIVNVARGKVIDTDALVSQLRANRLRGAVLDVTDPEPLPEDHPLWGFGNVLITPHNSGHTPKYYARLADIVAENLRRVDQTGSYDDLRNQVR